MKKISALLVVCSMLVLLFTACGSTDSGETPTSAPAVSEGVVDNSNAEDVTATEAPEATETPETTKAPEVTEKPEESPTPTAAVAERLKRFTYDNMNDLEYVMHYNSSYEVTPGGVLKVQYDEQYAEIKLLFNELFEMEHCKKITVRVKSEYGGVGIKLYDESLLADVWSAEKLAFYGSKANGTAEYEIVPNGGDFNVAGIGIMSLDQPEDAAQYIASVYEINFYMEKGYEPLGNPKYVKEELTAKGETTYTLNDLKLVKAEGARHETKGDGSVKITYDAQWGIVRYELPKAIDPKKCIAIVVDAEISEQIGIMFYDQKLMTDPDCDEVFTRWTWDKDSVTEFHTFLDSPEKLPMIYGIGFKASEPVTDSAAYTALVSGITFYMENDAVKDVPTNIAPDVTGDMTLLNTYGKEFEHFGLATSVNELNHPAVNSFIKQESNSTAFYLGNMYEESTLSVNPNVITVAEAKKRGYFIPENYKEEMVPALNFTGINMQLEAAAANGLKIGLHSLIWHGVNEEWFLKEGYAADGSLVSPEVMDARLELYAHTVADYVCKHKNASVVYYWVLVNEYYHSDEELSLYRRVYGNTGLEPGFVKLVYQVVDEVLREHGLRDQISLIYNDYNTFFVGDIGWGQTENAPEDIISLINFINSDGKICDGVGMQGHLDVYFPEDKSVFGKAAQKFVDAGFEVFVTELDIAIKEPRATSEEDQAEKYADILTDLVKINRNSGKIKSIVFWGMSDIDSWLKQYDPLLFSSPGVPKNAYFKVLQAYTELK